MGRGLGRGLDGCGGGEGGGGEGGGDGGGGEGGGEGGGGEGGAHLTKHAPKSAALCPCGWASVGTTKAASLPKDAHSSRMSSTHWLGLGLRSGLGLGSG